MDKFRRIRSCQLYTLRIYFRQDQLLELWAMLAVLDISSSVTFRFAIFKVNYEDVLRCSDS